LGITSQPIFSKCDNSKSLQQFFGHL